MMDIKVILLKYKCNKIDLDETKKLINELIINNGGYYDGDDIKNVFELGEQGKKNEILPKNDILEIFDDIDGFVNHIAHKGFFTIDDINQIYNAGKLNKNKNMNGDAIKDLFINGFKNYLLNED